MRAIAIAHAAAALIVVAATIAPTHAGAQAQAPRPRNQGDGHSGALVWGPAPAILPKGAQLAVVSGDPAKSGPYVVRLAMPDGYRIAPHFHPTDEHVAVRRGTFLVGMGDTFDRKRARTLNVRDTITAAAGMHHFAAARGRTVVEVSGMGPFQLTYVDPADTPKP